MKKQLLTSAMAMAMLAPTVSAFATPQDVTVSGSQQSSELTITGQIANSSGQLPEQVTVTMPTAASFMVDQDGNFSAPSNMTIENKSKVGVTVSVSSFEDTNPAAGAGITIVDFDTLASGAAEYDRSHVGLKLHAQGVTGGSDVDLTHGSINQKLVDIDANDNAPLSLVGTAGTGVKGDGTVQNETTSDLATSGANENFKLVFSIKRK